MKQKQEDEQEIDPECTFQPNLKASKKQTYHDGNNIIERSEQWIENKNRKLREMREKDKDVDLIGCTFKP